MGYVSVSFPFFLWVRIRINCELPHRISVTALELAILVSLTDEITFRLNSTSSARCLEFITQFY
jgi:hypothetical protein